MKPLRDILRLFLPETCAMCGDPMPEGVDFICTRCRWEMPQTGFWREVDNPVARIFHGHLPVVNASAFLWFVNDGNVRAMIHRFKYSGNWKMALHAGQWFGSELKQAGLYDGIDVVVPIPLHLRKLLRRGYNQSEYIARGISKAVDIPLDCRSVVRRRYNRSQTSRKKDERWENVKGIFAVKRPDTLAGKHILLIDDVLTTGATIISCAETILAQVPDCSISIAVLAVSRAELEKRSTF